jgi:hypothetical protein
MGVWSMSGRHGSKRNQRSSKLKARRRRIAGLGSGAGTFLALGLSPLGSPPPAHADEFDVIVDPIFNAIASALPGLVDPLAGVDPSAALDLGSLALPAADAAAGSDPVAAAASAAVPAASTSLAGLYDTYIYDPSHTWDQSWIDGTTFLGSLDSVTDGCTYARRGRPSPASVVDRRSRVGGRLRAKDDYGCVRVFLEGLIQGYEVDLVTIRRHHQN